MKIVEKSKFYPPNSNSLYNALLKQDKEAVIQCLEKGETIPEFLYMQTTNHDNLALLKFLLSFQPEKELYALKLSFTQGAVECFQHLTTIRSKTEIEELTQITPRKNIEAINSSLKEALYTEEPKNRDLPPVT